MIKMGLFRIGWREPSHWYHFPPYQCVLQSYLHPRVAQSTSDHAVLCKYWIRAQTHLVDFVDKPHKLLRYSYCFPKLPGLRKCRNFLKKTVLKNIHIPIHPGHHRISFPLRIRLCQETSIRIYRKWQTLFYQNDISGISNKNSLLLPGKVIQWNL